MYTGGCAMLYMDSEPCISYSKCHVPLRGVTTTSKYLFVM